MAKLKAELEQLKLAKPKASEEEGPILNPMIGNTLLIGGPTGGGGMGQNGGGGPMYPQATGWGGGF